MSTIEQIDEAMAEPVEVLLPASGPARRSDAVAGEKQIKCHAVPDNGTMRPGCGHFSSDCQQVPVWVAQSQDIGFCSACFPDGDPR